MKPKTLKDPKNFARWLWSQPWTSGVKELNWDGIEQHIHDGLYRGDEAVTE